MEKNLYIDASHPNETRVVLKSGESIEDYEYEGLKNNLIKNNIYLGKVSRVEPSLQAAFIDFGRDRHGFLSFNDIQSDYYQIPQSDLAKIKEEEERAREELLKESELEEQKNINEGNLDVNDPVEVKPESELEGDDQTTEESDALVATKASLSSVVWSSPSNSDSGFTSTGSLTSRLPSLIFFCSSSSLSFNSSSLALSSSSFIFAKSL